MPGKHNAGSWRVRPRVTLEVCGRGRPNHDPNGKNDDANVAKCFAHSLRYSRQSGCANALRTSNSVRARPQSAAHCMRRGAASRETVRQGNEKKSWVGLVDRLVLAKRMFGRVFPMWEVD